MIIKIYGGSMAEIVINSAEKPLSADELVRLLLAHDVTAANVVHHSETETRLKRPGINAAVSKEN